MVTVEAETSQWSRSLKNNSFLSHIWKGRKWNIKLSFYQCLLKFIYLISENENWKTKIFPYTLYSDSNVNILTICFISHYLCHSVSICLHSPPWHFFSWDIWGNTPGYSPGYFNVFIKTIIFSYRTTLKLLKSWN